MKIFAFEGEIETLSKFRSALEEINYKNAYLSALRQTCSSLKEILQINLLNNEICKKALSLPQNLAYLNFENKSVVMLLIEDRSRGQDGNQRFIVVCLSNDKEIVDKVVANLKEIVVQKVGVARDKIMNGDSDEIANQKVVRGLSKTQRTELISKVTPNMLSIFADSNHRALLRSLIFFPFSVFREDMFEKDKLGKLDVNTMVSAGIFEEMFSPVCKKCTDQMRIPPVLLKSKEEIYPILEKQSFICPTCGSKLGKDNSTIMRYVRFSKLGLELAKGLWLEAYVYSLLCEMRLPSEDITVCAVHEKDEVDAAFSDGKYLYLCECKDKIVGQNDVYVLAMKANRISADKKLGAHVDRVLMVSTEPISKDIMSEEKIDDVYGGIEYIPISGEPDTIKEKLIQLIEKSLEKQKEMRTKQLLELIIGISHMRQEFLPYGAIRDSFSTHY